MVTLSEDYRSKSRWSRLSGWWDSKEVRIGAFIVLLHILPFSCVATYIVHTIAYNGLELGLVVFDFLLGFAMLAIVVDGLERRRRF
jgi:hypothetical protein